MVLQSGPLGAGIGLPTSESVTIPMVGASTIDIEVPGDGKTVRGAYLDWMASAEVLHPLSAEHRDLIPEPFAAMAPLHPATQDSERFGTVTASLADETIRIGASMSQGRSEEHTSELQSHSDLVCRLLLEKKKKRKKNTTTKSLMTPLHETEITS